ncbi:DUF4192 domain-containing protein [Georgenia satyanarayanai]|uniref:DUF4192 domain-containing protein n=1 Tax=Georgenia satyanarayanai TaxID=860221 RepID=UPI00186B104E|nr:DUF4192 domain-containing protein [Georgenia satyanarayanai]
MDPTTITISQPEDIVAYLPYRLGFRPRDSVVLLAMCGARNRLGLVTRADLTHIGHPRLGAALVRDVARLMEEEGAHDVFVVLYSDLPRDRLSADPLVRRAVEHLRTLTSWADPPGPWVVGAGTYGCWGTGEECAPATRDVAELDQRPVVATLVLHGLALVPAREDLAVARTTDAERRRSATRAVREGRRRLAGLRARSGGGAAVPGAAFGVPGAVPAVDQREMDEWREEERRRWERLVALAVRGAVLPAGELGLLAAALEDNTVRDSVLCSVVHPLSGRVLDRARTEEILDLAMLPGGPPPDQDRVEPAAAVLRALAACVPGRSGALALGLLAWIAWWCADGARADVLARQALRARPRTRLAELVDQALAARLPPGWVRAGSGDPAAPGPPIR